MRTHPQIKTLLLLLVIGALFTAPLIAIAQEEGQPAGDADTSAEVPAAEAVDTSTAEEANTEEAPQGIGLLFLLMGFAGVFIVGGAMIGRDMFGTDDTAQPSSIP